MKYILLKNTLFKGWAKKGGKDIVFNTESILHKNSNDDGVKQGMIIDHYYYMHFVKRCILKPLSGR